MKKQKTKFDLLMQSINDCFSDLNKMLRMNRLAHSGHLKNINSDERLKEKAVKVGDDELALKLTNEITSMRKAYAYESGWIDGVQMAIKTFYYFIFIDTAIEDENDE